MNVLLILGHPRTDSFCGAVARAYRAGARDAGVNVREIAVADLEFDPDVHVESPSDQPLEADLADAQRRIEWADHLALVYPNWWATMPARLKGFFDRVFTSGFAFSFYDEGEGAGHEPLLDGTTAELIVTMDMPAWVYRWIYRQPGTNAVKRATLGFAGIRTTRVTNLGPIDDSTPDQREAWLEDVRELGRSLATGPESRSTRAKRTLKTWLKALRLQFYPMAWAAYTIGALAAVGSGDVFATRVFWIGFGFLFFLEATTVLSNEYADYDTDRENTFAGPFTGGSRVLVDDELSFEQLRRGIGVTGVLTAVFGLGLALATIGTGSVHTVAVAMAVLTALALGYTIPPLKLAYRTLGELDVAVTHSIGVLLLGFVALGGSWHDPLPWLLGVPFLLSIIPSITLAGVPDYEADRAADKRTIAVRFGIDGAVVVAVATTLAAALTGTLWQLVSVVPGAYSPIIYGSILHAALLGWLLWDRVWKRTQTGSLPGQINTVMAVALAYIGWFAIVPLVGLL
ncbi:NAD(P)H-dependent oxidoreductase [Halostagnicola kamekurae]|uniref:Putative NADPH-quinone reductase (Modulator of drug activity B) n=1 Tax=Halostagnicola kamekurae TaxID=619731 RepID=A0A1I6PII1_9EURY|nr:NAD(P)H-dependent oxidoreductase [Halostagnicola kamekurae]SFS40014.1 Putative NADPH-quinone reductase (modulator of drug activity B) [Halostagnicola kamekurae]